MSEFPNGLDRRREMMQAEVQITKLADGLGFGEGSISANELEQRAGAEACQAGVRTIESPEIIVPLDRDKTGRVVVDDGCGDGRGVKRVFQGIVEKTKSLHRAKVFGGGAAMVAATLIGRGDQAGASLNQLFSSAITRLDAKGLDFGAHTADHVKNPETDCGCGAIDGAPEIVQAAVQYREAIEKAVGALGVDADGLDEVMTNFAARHQAIKDQPYSGKQVMGEIEADDKIIKELKGPHLEAWIVLNKVLGHTVNQEAVRKATGGKLDVFAVDVWRLEDYAVALYDNAAERHQAFLSELVYTLATAAVLTKGDLPVYVIEPSTTGHLETVAA